MDELRQWFYEFWIQVGQTPLLEWFGVTFGVVQVLLAKSNNVYLYPFGIASVAITIYVLAGAGLYAEVLLNIYYLVMSIYGWIHWVGGSHTDSPRVAYASRPEWMATAAIVALGVPLLYLGLSYFTDSTVPVWDACVTATAWAGMWLLARRRIENWILLNISNALAIPLLIYKGLHLYGLLTVFLFIVAVIGYFSWRRIIHRERNGALAN